MLCLATGFAVVVVAVFAAGCAMITQPTLRSNKRSAAAVDPARLRAHVEVLTTRFHPRNYRNTNNLELCADYVAGHLREAGATVSFQEYEVENRVYKNVIGRFGPAEGERIVLAAHYDTAGATPGADDNASGVAGLIELGYLLGKEKLTGTVELVACPLEEPPFFATADMGSARHAKMLKDEGVKVLLMISIEMIGFFSDQTGSQYRPGILFRLLYPDKANFIAVVGTMDQRRHVRTVKELMRGTTDLRVLSVNAPRGIPGIDFSDHRNYEAEGYNAVMITDTSFYRNRLYHTPHDTADTLDYESMAKVVVGVFEAVRGISARPAAR